MNAVGNNGEDPWIYISRPSDATDILAVGALHGDSTCAAFSSLGYSADHRVKPDLSSLGVAVASISQDGNREDQSG